MINIIVNTEPMRPPLTGIGTYTKRLLNGLAQHPEVGNIYTFPADQGRSPCTYLSSSRKKLICRELARKIPGARQLRYKIASALFDRRTKKIIKPGGDYIYVEPGCILMPFDGPTVPIIYDLSHIVCPQFHPLERIKYLELNLTKTLHRATRIITISNFIKDQIVTFFQIDPDKIDIVYPAVDTTFTPMNGAGTNSVLGRFGLFNGYLLSIGTLEPRKNILGLVKSFMQLPKTIRRKHPLVIAGTRGWHMQKLGKEIKRMTETGDFHYLGYVPQGDLPSLYAGAQAFVYPSFYEGFGLPILEAMACGTPVVTSNSAAMPEAAGDSALLVDPNCTDHIADGIRRILMDGDLRKALVRKGFENAGRYGISTAVASAIASLSAAAKNMS